MGAVGSGNCQSLQSKDDPNSYSISHFGMTTQFVKLNPLKKWSVLKRHSKKSPWLVDSEQSFRTTAWTLLPKYSNASFKWLWLLPGGTMVDWGVNECLLLLLFKVGGMIFLCAFIYSFMYKRVDINFRVHICMWIWLQWSQERSLLTEKNAQHVFGLFSGTWLSFLILFFFIIIQSACSPL